MAEPPIFIDLRKDNQTTRQASNTALRKLIDMDETFAEDLANQAVGEIEKLWPDLRAERFASQDIVDLSNALRAGWMDLEFRMLRAFLVLWKDRTKNQHDMLPRGLVDLAATVNGLVSRQIGPVGELVAAAKVSDGPMIYRVREARHCPRDHDYYIDYFDVRNLGALDEIFVWEDGLPWLDDIDYEAASKKCRILWPDLEDMYIPTGIQLELIARDIRATHHILEFRLWRAFVVCWMTDPPHYHTTVNAERAESLRKMALAQLGPRNMVTHNDHSVTILRKRGEEDYDSAEDSDLDDEKREQARRHKLVTEVLYPRDRHAPVKNGPSKKRARVPSI